MLIKDKLQIVLSCLNGLQDSTRLCPLFILIWDKQRKEQIDYIDCEGWTTQQRETSE